MLPREDLDIARSLFTLPAATAAAAAATLMVECFFHERNDVLYERFELRLQIRTEQPHSAHLRAGKYSAEE